MARSFLYAQHKNRVAREERRKQRARAKFEPSVQAARRRAESEYAAALRSRDHVASMLQNGWCIHQVRHLVEKFDIITFSELAKMQLSQERQVDHTACRTATSCVAHNVDMDSYQTAHQRIDCSCDHLAVTYENLVALIGKGHVPLVSIEFTKDGSNRMELHLHKRTVRSKYVAISHVWADGLGNPAENSLPICQLEYLSSRLKNLYGKSNQLFWMDTLCIPVKPEHENLRTRSIDSMASIYAGANLVLVLDRELRNTEATSIEQCLARITCSIWMTRCWTLQEGILAAKCAFQFLDATLIALTKESDDRLDWELVEQRDSREERRSQSFLEPLTAWISAPLPTTLMEQDEEAQKSFFEEVAKYRTLRRLNHFLEVEFFGSPGTFLESYDRFVHVWNELARRSTTKPEDVLCILANLLGMSAQRITALDFDKRLPAIIFSMSAVPFSLLLHNAQRGSIRGLPHANQWVPADVTNTTLTPSPLMLEVNSSTLEFYYHLPWMETKFSPWWGEIEVYTIDEVLAPTTKRVTLQTRDNPTMALTFELDYEFDHDPNLPSFCGTCFVVQEAPSSSTSLQARRGAVFYVTEQNKKHLSLYYSSSATVHSSCNDYGGRECTQVGFETKITIQYGRFNPHKE